MDRDATFLLALVMGASGWVLFARDHRAGKAAHATAADDPHPSDEGS
jgi:hypothetical protein